MSRLAYLAGRVVGLLVQPFIDGVLDGAFGMPDEDRTLCDICWDPDCDGRTSNPRHAVAA